MIDTYGSFKDAKYFLKAISINHNIGERMMIFKIVFYVKYQYLKTTMISIFQFNNKFDHKYNNTSSSKI